MVAVMEAYADWRSRFRAALVSWKDWRDWSAICQAAFYLARNWSTANWASLSSDSSFSATSSRAVKATRIKRSAKEQVSRSSEGGNVEEFIG
jgi:hypothetical protein